MQKPDEYISWTSGVDWRYQVLQSDLVGTHDKGSILVLLKSPDQFQSLELLQIEILDAYKRKLISKLDQ